MPALGQVPRCLPRHVFREFAPISTAKQSDSGSTPEPRRAGVAWPRLRGDEPQPPTDPPRLMATKTWPCHPDGARRPGGVHREVSVLSRDCPPTTADCQLSTDN